MTVIGNGSENLKTFFHSLEESFINKIITAIRASDCSEKSAFAQRVGQTPSPHLKQEEKKPDTPDLW